MKVQVLEILVATLLGYAPTIAFSYENDSPFIRAAREFRNAKEDLYDATQSAWKKIDGHWLKKYLQSKKRVLKEAQSAQNTSKKYCVNLGDVLLDPGNNHHSWVSHIPFMPREAEMRWPRTGGGAFVHQPSIFSGQDLSSQYYTLSRLYDCELEVLLKIARHDLWKLQGLIQQVKAHNDSLNDPEKHMSLAFDETGELNTLLGAIHHLDRILLDRKLLALGSDFQKAIDERLLKRDTVAFSKYIKGISTEQLVALNFYLAEETERALTKASQFLDYNQVLGNDIRRFYEDHRWVVGIELLKKIEALKPKPVIDAHYFLSESEDLITQLNKLSAYPLWTQVSYLNEKRDWSFRWFSDSPNLIDRYVAEIDNAIMKTMKPVIMKEADSEYAATEYRYFELSNLFTFLPYLISTLQSPGAPEMVEDAAKLYLKNYPKQYQNHVGENYVSEEEKMHRWVTVIEFLRENYNWYGDGDIPLEKIGKKSPEDRQWVERMMNMWGWRYNIFNKYNENDYTLVLTQKGKKYRDDSDGRLPTIRSYRGTESRIVIYDNPYDYITYRLEYFRGLENAEELVKFCNQANAHIRKMKDAFDEEPKQKYVVEIINARSRRYEFPSNPLAVSWVLYQRNKPIQSRCLLPIGAAVCAVFTVPEVVAALGVSAQGLLISFPLTSLGVTSLSAGLLNILKQLAQNQDGNREMPDPGEVFSAMVQGLFVLPALAAAPGLAVPVAIGAIETHAMINFYNHNYYEGSLNLAELGMIFTAAHYQNRSIDIRLRRMLQRASEDANTTLPKQFTDNLLRQLKALGRQRKLTFEEMGKAVTQAIKEGNAKLPIGFASKMKVQIWKFLIRERLSGKEWLTELLVRKINEYIAKHFPRHSRLDPNEVYNYYELVSHEAHAYRQVTGLGSTPSRPAPVTPTVQQPARPGTGAPSQPTGNPSHPSHPGPRLPTGRNDFSGNPGAGNVGNPKLPSQTPFPQLQQTGPRPQMGTTSPKTPISPAKGATAGRVLPSGSPGVIPGVSPTFGGLLSQIGRDLVMAFTPDESETGVLKEMPEKPHGAIEITQDTWEDSIAELKGLLKEMKEADNPRSEIIAKSIEIEKVEHAIKQLQEVLESITDSIEEIEVELERNGSALSEIQIEKLRTALENLKKRFLNNADNILTRNEKLKRLKAERAERIAAIRNELENSSLDLEQVIISEKTGLVQSGKVVFGSELSELVKLIKANPGIKLTADSDLLPIPGTANPPPLPETNFPLNREAVKAAGLSIQLSEDRTTLIIQRRESSDAIILGTYDENGKLIGAVWINVKIPKPDNAKSLRPLVIGKKSLTHHNPLNAIYPGPARVFIEAGQALQGAGG